MGLGLWVWLRSFRFLGYFFLRGGGPFLQGFCENVLFLVWFFVVKLWWIAGETW
jgi:hypothetical protein